MAESAADELAREPHGAVGEDLGGSMCRQVMADRSFRIAQEVRGVASAAEHRQTHADVEGQAQPPAGEDDERASQEHEEPLIHWRQ